MTIQVTPNPDGTYEVTCGNESTTVGMPTGAVSINFPPISASGGGVAAHIINLAGLPGSSGPYGLEVSSIDEIIADLDGSARQGRPFGVRQFADYTLLGDGGVDVGHLYSSLGSHQAGEEALTVRIFVGFTRG